MHVPKCGSTFASAIAEAHCPWLVPAPRGAIEPPDILRGDRRCAAKMTRFAKDHDGVVPRPDILAKTVTILRNPEERLVSGFLHNFHDCEPIRKRQRAELEEPTQGSEWWLKHAKNPTLVKDYALCTQGMVTLMLNNVLKRINPYSKPTHVEAQLAVQRVDQLAFVGIHERWPQSICLYRAMFGGDNMSDVPFGAQRTAAQHSTVKDTLRQTIRDIGWYDHDDWNVYRAALKRFQRDVDKYLKSDNSTAGIDDLLLF